MEKRKVKRTDEMYRNGYNWATVQLLKHSKIKTGIELIEDRCGDSSHVFDAGAMQALQNYYKGIEHLSTVSIETYNKPTIKDIEICADNICAECLISKHSKEYKKNSTIYFRYV